MIWNVNLKPVVHHYLTQIWSAFFDPAAVLDHLEVKNSVTEIAISIAIFVATVVAHLLMEIEI